MFSPTVTAGDVLAIMALIGGVVGGYVSVRVDIARTRSIAEHAKDSADQAHDRIDRVIAEVKR